jgi:hypothetical protein
VSPRADAPSPNQPTATRDSSRIRAAHVLGEDPPRLDAPHDVDAHVAVKRCPHVLRPHRRSDADGSCLVAAPGVEGAGDLSLAVQDVAALLDPSRHEHVAVDAEQVLAVEARLAHLVQRPHRACLSCDRHRAEP